AGKVPKLVERVQHISFSGEHACERNQLVMYVTERAVFELRSDGIELTEVADGVDVQTDILDRMQFRPIVRDVKPMRLN
ncbi:MAG: acyl CoA:acetate/3-ketoacid CoA transferase, partial [Betaproteobacteria bacterium]